MGVHGKIKPVGVVACIHKIHCPDDVAGLHGVVLLQCLHTGCKGVVGAVGVQLYNAGNDAELLHGCIVLDPALFQVVGVARCRQILRNSSGICFHDAPALLVLILGGVPPPHKLVVPLGGVHRVLVTDRVDAGIKVGGVGGFAQVEQIASVLDFLGGLPLGFHCLITVVQNVQPGGSIKAAIKIPAEHFEHQLVQNVPHFTVVLANAVLVGIAELHHKVAQRRRHGAKLEAFHLAFDLIVMCVDQVLQKLAQRALVVEGGDGRIVEVTQCALAVHHPPVVKIGLVLQHPSAPDLFAIPPHLYHRAQFLQHIVLCMIPCHGKNKAAALADLTGQLGGQHQCLRVVGTIEQQLCVRVAVGVCVDLVHISFLVRSAP